MFIDVRLKKKKSKTQEKRNIVINELEIACFGLRTRYNLKKKRKLNLASK